MKARYLIQYLLFFLFLTMGSALTAQDTIIFEKKHPFLVKVTQESDTEVQYRKYGVTDSSVFVMKKRFISAIRYQYPDSAQLLFRTDTAYFRKDLDIWVTKNDDNNVIKGLLHRIDDSTLVLRKQSILTEGGEKFAQQLQSFSYSKIHQLQVRKHRQIREYAVVGTAVGFIVGTLAGLVIFEDTPPCDPLVEGVNCDSSLSSPKTQWDKSLLLGLGGAGGGFITGSAIGAIKVKIPIRGKRDQFNASIPRLERMARFLEEKK